ncbi:nuclear transport factor 2 family protein [uncultured Hyphomicrobium sp.]|uniref:nuclear transport factor 2 family protein n=1 Tax=uncultured Hyphomicrobium sp. TaxID=194373 RepID=UPI0025E12C9F|nr:nuclear transport factor 2 family protein [uncultured Hyphomicrobium sp.]
MKKLDAELAREILDSAHNAWSRGDVEAMLAYYDDDVTYWCNAGSLDGIPYIIQGKQGLRTFLRSILAVAESATATEHFQFEDGIGRAKVEAYIRHRRTGHVLSGCYRQIVTYRGRKIVRLDEYHDAAKMAAFWRMVTCDEAAENSKTAEDSQ